MRITRPSGRMAALDLLNQRVQRQPGHVENADIVLLVAFEDADSGETYIRHNRNRSYELITCASASGAKALCAQGGIDCVVVDVDGLDDYAPHFIHALSADAPQSIDVIAAGGYLPRGLADQLHTAGARTVVKKTTPATSSDTFEYRGA